ncbi:electron transfer flavoprotein subunit beta/FixA family protein [Saxibacter everestensis]|uniref:Electron transfer flavoprotein subunit beta n=1 Tax=Saxibacter everestensis TaxID=2909229 RepID=A0ABY8QXG4_9MICO|nr:electron transfer flavoprotein subunit beta/FixA family protein [Brevibacteriaceae bacterium ZFBP1038]
MKIVVFVKYVPDAQSDRTFVDADKTTDRSVDGLLSELDEYPLEAALKIVEASDGEVIALTVGPDDAVDAVRKALQIGANSGVHILDDALHGSDASATSLVLAKAIEKLGEESPVDLVLTGIASTDGSTSLVPAQLAERLGWPQVTFASTLDATDSGVTIRRDGDVSSETVEASLPAVVSVTDQINEPRYPSFKGIMAAKKKPLDEWTIDDLGLNADQVGFAGSWTEVTDIAARPPRQAGEIITDEGDGGTKLVDFLAAQKLV